MRELHALPEVRRRCSARGSPRGLYALSGNPAVTFPGLSTYDETVFAHAGGNSLVMVANRSLTVSVGEKCPSERHEAPIHGADHVAYDSRGRKL